MPMKKTRREVRAMRNLATNRSSKEISQVSSERVDLRVQIVLCLPRSSFGCSPRVSSDAAKGMWSPTRRDRGKDTLGNARVSSDLATI